jgi:hypothetical protein
LSSARGRARSEQLGFGHKVDAGIKPGKAGGQAGGGEANFFVAAFKLGQRVEGGRIEVTGVQKVEQAGLAAFALGQHQHALWRGADVGFQARQRVVGAAHHGEFAQFLEVGVVHHVLHRRAQRQLGVLVDPGIKLLGA